MYLLAYSLRNPVWRAAAKSDRRSTMTRDILLISHVANPIIQMQYDYLPRVVKYHLHFRRERPLPWEINSVWRLHILLMDILFGTLDIFHLNSTSSSQIVPKIRSLIQECILHMTLSVCFSLCVCLKNLSRESYVISYLCIFSECFACFRGTVDKIANQSGHSCKHPRSRCIDRDARKGQLP